MEIFGKVSANKSIMERDWALDADLGIQMIVDPNCYITKSVYKAIRQINKPNSHRPVFRKVFTKEPTMYKVGGTIICHPVLVEKIKATVKKAQERMIERINDQMDATVFGVLSGSMKNGAGSNPVSNRVSVLFDRTPPIVDPSTLEILENPGTLNLSRFYRDISMTFGMSPSEVDKTPLGIIKGMMG